MKGSYLDLGEDEFGKRIDKLYSRLENCNICAWECGINRLKGEKGKCNSGKSLKLNSAFSHFGEESCLVGKNGSGTIFLSNCSMSCQFCQNYQISQLGFGEKKTEKEVAEIMLDLQGRNCHNINWVTPSHFVPQLVKSLKIAKKGGLNLPIVYNTGGYDNIETLKLLNGIVDIYMPDMKYGSNKKGLKYSNIPNYWDVNRKAIKEMYRQVGDLKVDKEKIAQKGLLVRHLVLPNQAAESEKIMEFLSNEISEDTYVNIMNQYFPSYKANEYDNLKRSVTQEEILEVKNKAREVELYRGF